MTEIPSEQKVPPKKLFLPTASEVIYLVKDKILPGAILGILIIFPISLIFLPIFIPFVPSRNGILEIFILSVILGVGTLMLLENGYKNTSSSKSRNKMNKEDYIKKKEDYIKKKEDYIQKKENYIKQCKANPNMMFIKAMGKFYGAVVLLFISVLILPNLPDFFIGVILVLLVADVIAILYFYLNSIYSGYMSLVYKKQNGFWIWAYILFGIFGALIILILEDKNQE